jgi:hypothetical protein
MINLYAGHKTQNKRLIFSKYAFQFWDKQRAKKSVIIKTIGKVPSLVHAMNQFRGFAG